MAPCWTWVSLLRRYGMVMMLKLQEHFTLDFSLPTHVLFTPKKLPDHQMTGFWIGVYKPNLQFLSVTFFEKRILEAIRSRSIVCHSL